MLRTSNNMKGLNDGNTLKSCSGQPTKGGDWIQLAQDMAQWRSTVNSIP
jgi:hypothetical protein